MGIIQSTKTIYDNQCCNEQKEGKEKEMQKASNFGQYEI